MPNVQIPSSESLLTDKKPSLVWFVFFQNLWRAVRGNTSIKLGGTLNVNTTQVSNSGSSSTDLISYSLQNNNLANDGDRIEIIAWGSFAANSNSKTLSLIFGTQTISSFTGNFNGGYWQYRANIIRISSNEQAISIELASNNTTIQSNVNYPLSLVSGTQDNSSSLIIKCVGQGSASDDLIQNALIINLFPYS